MAFAEVAELEDYLGRTLDTAERTRASVLLDLATSVIQSHTGQQIEAGTSTETWVGPRRITLRQFPVTDVTSVTFDGETVAPTDYTFDSSGVLWLWWAVPWTPRSTVVVEYEHGYADVPGDIRAVCLSLAARAFASESTGLVLEQIGSHVRRYSDPGTSTRGEGLALTEADRQLLAPYTNYVAA